MASMTIRNIPPPLHEALKAKAAGNRRSLQSEIVATLEEAVLPGRVPVAQILEKARRFRAATRIKTTDGEIRRFKRQGRK
jgi:plasmid stability protein